MAENRMTPLAQRDMARDHSLCRCSVRRDCKVLDISHMRAFRVLQSMLFVLRVEMGACRLEIRRLARRVFMNVNRMLARGQVSEIKRNLHSMRVVGTKSGSPGTRSLRILQVHDDGRVRRECSGEEAHAQ